MWVCVCVCVCVCRSPREAPATRAPWVWHVGYSPPMNFLQQVLWVFSFSFIGKNVLVSSESKWKKGRRGRGREGGRGRERRIVFGTVCTIKGRWYMNNTSHHICLVIGWLVRIYLYLCFESEGKFSNLILFAYASKWGFLGCAYIFQRHIGAVLFLGFIQEGSGGQGTVE